MSFLLLIVFEVEMEMKMKIEMERGLRSDRGERKEEWNRIHD